MDHETLIEETPIVVLDTETTGLRAGIDRIIEVGAVRLVAGRIVDRYEQLVDPGVDIPYTITRLTGITNEMVGGRPPAEVVMPHVEAFLGDAVIVGHNVQFDLRFLEAEFRAAGLQPPANPSLCTARLARRLLRALPSRSLASLRRHYGISDLRSHRALDDAEATAIVLQHLIASVTAERRLRTIGELLRWQYLPYRATLKEPAFVERLREELRDALPESPGVYLHHDGQDRLLYVGKARNLRNRVMSYFTAYAAHPQHIRRLVREVRKVTWQETESELSALLLESRLIKELRPRLNRADTVYRSRPFIRIDNTGPEPEARCTFEIFDDGAEYYGPLSSRKEAGALIELARELTDHEREATEVDGGEADLRPAAGPPMPAQAGRTRRQRPATAPDSPRIQSESAVRELRNFLTGTPEEVKSRIRERMMRAAEKRDYERAAWWKRRLDVLERVEGRHSCVAAPVHGLSCVLVQLGSREDRIEVYALRYGRLAASTSIDLPVAASEEQSLRALLAPVYGVDSAPPSRYSDRERDQVRIVAGWLVTHSQDLVRLDWSPKLDLEPFLQTVLAACRSLKSKVRERK